ncbi:hypothetical protein CDAR_103001 [Caerostris darwini]|uniref:Uncharacterized protein n=1 Tax=Caerostris darwini TaxID=1538125 RepID=A0AAV4URQ7_9ARAC|nr:hypothetical protein CDAR_103001 [Caerostris darwini]
MFAYLSFSVLKSKNHLYKKKNSYPCDPRKITRRDISPNKFDPFLIRLMPCSLIGADNEVPHQTQTRCLNNRPTTRSGQRPSSFLSRGAGWDRCREKPRGWSDGGGLGWRSHA